MNNLETGTYAYKFDENETYLQQLFGASISQHILKFLHNQYTQVFITLTILVFLVLRLLIDFVFGFDHWLYHVYLIYILSTSFLIWIPVEILWIISVNKAGLQLLIRSFVFWLKIIASLCYGVTHFIYACLTHHSPVRNMALVSYAIFNLLVIPLVVLWISIFDGINVNKRWKILFSGILGSIFLFFSINYEFLVSQEEDYVVQIPVINQSISFYSGMASALRLLCIFSFKQLFVVYYYPNKCITIRYTPHLVWYKAENIDDSNILYTINLDEVSNERNDTPQSSLTGSIGMKTLLSGCIYAYKLNENDIHLTKLVGGNIARNILNFLHNPLNQFWTALSMLGFVVLRAFADFIFPTNHLIYYIYGIYLAVTCYLVWFPLTVTWITISNRLAFKLLLGSFEFWLKVAVTYCYTIINLIYNYQIHDNALNRINLVCYSVFNLVIIPLAVVCVAILDAVQVNKIWKMTFSGITGGIFLFFSFHYEFSISTQDDYIVSVPYIHRYMSFCSVMASCGRIIGIFSARQFFLTYYYHDKCVLIRYTPYLIWNTEQNIDNPMELHQISVDDIGIQANVDLNVSSWEIISEQIKMELVIKSPK